MSNPLENMMKKRGEYIEQVKKLHNLRTQENKALYGETSKKTKQFLQDTKVKLRLFYYLNIFFQTLEVTLDDIFHR